jgi:hypothetical protein
MLFTIISIPTIVADHCTAVNHAGCLTRVVRFVVLVVAVVLVLLLAVARLVVVLPFVADDARFAVFGAASFAALAFTGSGLGNASTSSSDKIRGAVPSAGNFSM